MPHAWQLKTLVILSLIVIAGVLVGGAVVFVLARYQPEVVQPEVVRLTSAQEAVGYAHAGWRCKQEGKPMLVYVLEFLARVENDANAGDIFRKAPVECTQPGGKALHVRRHRGRVATGTYICCRTGRVQPRVDPPLRTSPLAEAREMPIPTG